jgi:hypothetical protein
MLGVEPMTLDEFKSTTRGTEPPAGLSLALQSLWWMEKGDWNRAHGLIDDATGADECWVHAHLHRVEGDFANAGYWYRKARMPLATAPLERERQEMIVILLD